MRNFQVLIAVFVLAFTLMGCQSEKQQSTIAKKADFSFNTPEGYSIADIGDTACAIYRDDEVVGGIVLTDLNNGSIDDIDKIELRQYLDMFAPAPLIYEYMAMYFADDDYSYISINFKVTDNETRESSNYHHYLFERASGCYDLWLSDELVNEDVQKEFLTTVNATVDELR